MERRKFLTNLSAAGLSGLTTVGMAASPVAMQLQTGEGDSMAHHPDWLGGETPKVYNLAPQAAG